MQTKPQPIELVGSSPFIGDLRQDIGCAAAADARVLLTGEEGTGKRFFARTVHVAGARRSAPLVTIDCAGVPDAVLESELFGGRRGFIERAKGGTLLLHEVGELSLRMQAQTCELLENNEAPRLMATTSKNLGEQVISRKFREDLYYRLNTVHLVVAPLRERKADIQPLLVHFLKAFAGEQGAVPRLTDETVERLVAYSWPGNVRELKMVAECLAALRSDVIHPADLPQKISGKGIARLQEFKLVPARSSRLAARLRTAVAHRFGSAG